MAFKPAAKGKGPPAKKGPPPKAAPPPPNKSKKPTPGPSKSAGPPIASTTMAPQDAVYKASPGSLASVFTKGVK